jgi:subtilisin family serine protease
MRKELVFLSDPIGKTEYFSYNQLNKIVSAYEGKETQKSKETKAEGPQVLSGDSIELSPMLDTLQDVLILPPKSLTKSTETIDSGTVAKDLSEKGIEIDDKLNVVPAVTARLDRESLAMLKDEGYQIFDNSRRSLLPGIPKSSYKAEGDKPWDMPKIEDVKWTEADKLHQKGITGKGQVIAIIDSGYDHPQKPLKAWKDIADGKSKPWDPHGHGTHVAGDAIKMAPDADLVGVRVMGADGSGRPSDILKGLQWVVENKEKYNISVVNMSLGGPPDGAPWHLDPINRAVAIATKAGLTVVAAAGNDGPERHTIGSPADSPHALTVGAALNPSVVSDFSSRGPTDDRLAKPDVIAPGEYITSWAVPQSELDQIATVMDTLRKMTPSQLRQLFIAKPDLVEALGLPGDIVKKDDVTLEKTTKMNLPPMYKPTPNTVAGPGTSFAAPEVAGIVAGLKQVKPDATPEKLIDAVEGTAKNMGAQFSVIDQGKGFIQAEKAAEQLKKA